MAGIEDLSAVKTLEKDRFVDDLLGGNEMREGVNLQVYGTTTILGWGGFSLKLVVHSGVKLCYKASSNGETVKMLGYSGQQNLTCYLLDWGNSTLIKRLEAQRNPI